MESEAGAGEPERAMLKGEEGEPSRRLLLRESVGPQRAWSVAGVEGPGRQGLRGGVEGPGCRWSGTDGHEPVRTMPAVDGVGAGRTSCRVGGGGP